MADYFVEGGDVLENKLGITDPEQLREAEEDAFSDTAADILNEDLSGAILDFNFFKQTPRSSLWKVYPFAGQIRTVNITKQDSSIPFCYADFIESEANRIFQNLEAKNYLKNETKAEFVNNIAELAMDLNALHPFREGNGRTIRFYLQLLANNAGYLLDYNEVGREEIIEADNEPSSATTSSSKKCITKSSKKLTMG
jgi:cell filamentation protein